jgi:hypothetical protein
MRAAVIQRRRLEPALWSSFRQSKPPLWAADVPLHPCSSWILPLLSRGRQQETGRAFKQWLNKATLLNHIDGHLSTLPSGKPVTCPHPCCSGTEYGSALDFRRHLFNVHSIEEPRSNCVTRKRHWSLEPEESKTVPEEQLVEEGKRRKLV